MRESLDTSKWPKLLYGRIEKKDASEIIVNVNEDAKKYLDGKSESRMDEVLQKVEDYVVETRKIDYNSKERYGFGIMGKICCMANVSEPESLKSAAEVARTQLLPEIESAYKGSLNETLNLLWHKYDGDSGDLRQKRIKYLLQNCFFAEPYKSFDGKRFYELSLFGSGRFNSAIFPIEDLPGKPDNGAPQRIFVSYLGTFIQRSDRLNPWRFNFQLFLAILAGFLILAIMIAIVKAPK
jgi:hypothetical protein